jgi:hypothetical protein
MRIDEQATLEARVQNEIALARLDLAFGITPADRINAWRVPTDTRPVRLKAGCPPVRDAEHRAKHRKRKAARAARRRNRK